MTFAPRQGGIRLLTTALATAALLAAATACTGSQAGQDGSSAKASDTFGPKGYRGLGPGTTKDAALAGGTLQNTPLSALSGCAFYGYHDGPAADPAVIAAESAATTKVKDTGAAADRAQAEAAAAGQPGAGASAREYADAAARSAQVAKLLSDSTSAIAEETTLMAARDKAFEATGGAKFGTTGHLKQLIAPPKARTAEGIGTGSTEDELKKAYPKAKATEGGWSLPLDGTPGWELFFATDTAKVTAVSLFGTEEKCV
ncbi:hypothetical protein ACGFX4_08160 [Kitasatospora sp. NPDC048365]|uniref:hypothetical protein n=1 Tax=Kitasatospora sp. NPDC048365 TaxID=3364050 RepID=UPI00371341C1